MKTPDKIYTVQIGDAYEDSGHIVYAGTDKAEALEYAEKHLNGGCIIRLMTWADGICDETETGKPEIRWEQNQ